MMTKTFVALSAITVPVPASENPQYPADRQIVALGLLEAATREGKRWRFRNRAIAIGAGEQDEIFLQWLSQNLPEPATLISWQLDSHLMLDLMDAAATAMPTIAHRVMIRLSEVLRTGPVDLAIGHGGAAAAPLPDVAADNAIGCPTTAGQQRLSDWSWGEIDRLRADAADEALALWCLFLRKSHLSGLEAEAATDQWRRRRSRLRVEPPGGPEGEDQDEVSGGMKKVNPASNSQGD